MTNLLEMDWPLETRGDIDHRKVEAPYIRLSHHLIGEKGDSVYVYDFRVAQPSQGKMTTTQLHSLEHFLLAGFRKYLEKNFANVAPMGCQTGFYIVLLNEGRSETVCQVLKDILTDITQASEVPYVSAETCGQPPHHSLEESKTLAHQLLDQEGRWKEVLLAA
jgi:S-ribosylhomocysteine lyase